VKLLRVAVLGAAVTLLAGCGSSGSPGTKGNGEAAKSVNQIVADAETAAKSATSVHVGGSGISGNTPLSLDLYLVAGKGGRGHLTLNGLSFDIVRIGPNVYFKGDSRFWSHFGSGLLVALLKGRWLEEPVSHRNLASFAPLTDLPKLFHAILGTHGKLTKGATTTVNGQEAIAIVDRSSSGGTLYVAATGTPYPLELVSPGSKHGSISFDQWNQPMALSAPANPIDVSKLKGFKG
jgi:hypothetical protein